MLEVEGPACLDRLGLVGIRIQLVRLPHPGGREDEEQSQADQGGDGGGSQEPQIEEPAIGNLAARPLRMSMILGKRPLAVKPLLWPSGLQRNTLKTEKDRRSSETLRALQSRHRAVP